MVSSYLVESLRSPTQVLLDFYNSEGGKDAPDFPKAVSKHFSDIFKDPVAFFEIPALDASQPPESFPDRSLVRFRAMIQDTSPSPEMYLSKLTSGALGGWGIHETTEKKAEEAIDYAALRDCMVVWAVNVPGESQWYKEAHDGAPRVSCMSRVSSAIMAYRSVAAESPHRAPRPHKFPVPKEPHIGVQVKASRVYDSLGNHAPKTADVMEFVGILSTEQLHTVDIETEESSPVDVPTLHVLFARPHSLAPPTSTTVASTDIRDELIAWVADEALGGDRDAAEWIIISSIARVQSRIRSLHPPSLTISHFPSPSDPSAIPTLVHVLSLLFPLVTPLPLSLELLNQVPFVPESKQEDLHSGLLQIPHASTVVVTESGVKEGKLVERGVLNVMAIQDVMTSQTLPYRFPFSEFSFPTDLAFVVLAEGTKSAFLKTDISVPLKPDNSSSLFKPVTEVTRPPPDKLKAFRDLLMGAKTRKIEVKEATSEFIQDDFVENRKSDKSVTGDDLKRSIMVARQVYCGHWMLSGLLLHEDELTIDMWKRAKDLEKRRLARLQ
ncbi:mini-chromosome maintenance replisome factor-domain-containing protein [Amylostereum chailletii]|nr:mini-chromosome maintenance replisome factor-domain-containing protein [Amylostereum chailletii]